MQDDIIMLILPLNRLQNKASFLIRRKIKYKKRFQSDQQTSANLKELNNYFDLLPTIKQPLLK